jgi:hypothetical protein
MTAPVSPTDRDVTDSRCNDLSYDAWLDGTAHTRDMTRRQLLKTYETPADIEVLLREAFAAGAVVLDKEADRV